VAVPEAINLVAQSYGRTTSATGDEIIVSELEHHANIVPWQLLAEQSWRKASGLFPINTTDGGIDCWTNTPSY